MPPEGLSGEQKNRPGGSKHCSIFCKHQQKVNHLICFTVYIYPVEGILNQFPQRGV